MIPVTIQITLTPSQYASMFHALANGYFDKEALSVLRSARSVSAPLAISGDSVQAVKATEETILRSAGVKL